MEGVFFCTFAPSKVGQFFSRAEHGGGRSPAALRPKPSTAAWYNMYNYIPHPSNCRVSSELLSLLMHEGAAGYGVYWMLLEMLRDAPCYKIEYSREVLAYTLHLPEVELLGRVCERYNLFVISNDGFLSCPWLNGAMGEYDERKAKLREAGRRGAAHRWGGASEETSKPIATLSKKDADPLAHDVIPFKVTQDDFTLPTQGEGRVVSEDYVNMLRETQVSGHAPAYVASICLHYGMKESTCEYICEHSENASLTNPYYQRFAAIVRRIQAEKWRPEHPDGFFLKKVFQ